LSPGAHFPDCRSRERVLQTETEKKAQANDAVVSKAVGDAES